MAKGQQRSNREAKEAEKREGQGNRRRTKPKGRGMAAGLRFSQKEVERKEIEMAGVG